MYAGDGSAYFDIYALINWDFLDEYWIAEQSVGVPDSSLLTGYLKQWFRNDRFSPPCIEWQPQSKTVSFVNGRHRLALVTKYQNNVPVILCGQSILYPEIHRAIIKILTPDDEIELPDLDFVKPCGRIPIVAGE